MRAIEAWRRAGEALRIGAAASALALVLGACAPSLQHEHADLRTLTREQMAPNHFHSAYEAVQALRGNWLNPPANTVFGRYGNAGTSPVIAGGLLWVYDPGGTLRAYVPETGATVASLPAGSGHWQSPIVSDGRVALAEGNANNHATAGVLDIYTLP